MLSFLFGKKRTMRRKKHFSKKNTKPSSKIVKLARKYQISLTMKRGSKRVYKSSRILKKQITTAMRRSKSLFGKKNAKPSSKLIKLAKKYKLKVTMKRGSKKVYKSSKVLKKQITTAMRKMSKKNKRTNRFGMAGPFMNTTPDFGYSNGVDQVAGLPGQSTEFVDQHPLY